MLGLWDGSLMKRLLAILLFATCAHAGITVGTSFEGTVGTTSSPGVPSDRDHPDDSIAVGPSHIMHCTDQGIEIFNKTGTSLQNYSWSTFYGAATLQPANTGHPTLGTVNDPYCVYDPHRSIWYVAHSANATYIFYSTSNDPTSTWNAFLCPGGDTGDLTMKVAPDKNGVYVVWSLTSATTPSSPHNLTALVAFPITGGTIDIANVNSVSRNLPFELRPVYDANASKASNAAEMFIAHNCDTSNNDPGNGTPDYCTTTQNWTNPLKIVTIKGTWSGTTFTLASAAATVTSTSQTYNIGSNSACQQNGSTTIKEREDHRFHNAVSSPDSTSIYAAMGSQISSHCGAFWFQVQVSDGSILQQGTISDGSNDYSFPSVAVDSQGNLLIGVTRSSTTEYASSYAFGRLTTDTVNILQGPTLVYAGTQVYACSLNPVGWGTYQTSTIDPSSTLKIWTVSGYGGSATACIWHNRISQLQIAAASNTPSTMSGTATISGVSTLQ